MPDMKKVKLINEFKQFALKGNVLDLAVGVIIGGAFSKITSSLVTDIFTPVIGLVIGGVNFNNLNIPIRTVEGAEPLMLNIGSFLQSVVDFFILALIVFAIVKMMGNLRRRTEEVALTKPSAEVALLTEIRDLLKDNNK